MCAGSRRRDLSSLKHVILGSILGFIYIPKLKKHYRESPCLDADSTLGN